MTDEEILYERMIHPELYTIDELKKVKEEIRKRSSVEWYVSRLDRITTIELTDKIIDKHISELKGNINDTDN